MAMMQMVANDGVLITDIPNKPDYVYVMGGTEGKREDMLREEAELYKENHLRSKLGLEVHGMMPSKQLLPQRVCRRCRQPSSSRCLACRMAYCSRSCQRLDWNRHVFICAIKNRPSDFDRLKLFLRRLKWILEDEIKASKLVIDLFSDNHLCRAFGFVNCRNRAEASFLLCIYSMIVQNSATKIQRMIDENSLGVVVEAWMKVSQPNVEEASVGSHCISWFLEQRTKGFDIPNWDGDYLYQTQGLDLAERVFSVRAGTTIWNTLSPDQRSVFWLYARLFRDFNDVPDAHSTEWFEFGFCFCANDEQKSSLANAYIKLAETRVPLADVARAWTDSSLPLLMKSRGIDTAFLDAHRIELKLPNIDEFGIYRLQAEVTHALSGRHCECCKPKGICHPKHETILSMESYTDYAFHGTVTWERWQLLNFYKHVFQHPNFDARKMHRAKHDPDSSMLETYLDSLVPGFRRKIGNLDLGSAMFPNLKGKVRFSNGRPHCYCVVHNTFAPEGLDWTTPLVIRKIQGEANVMSKDEGMDGEEV